MVMESDMESKIQEHVKEPYESISVEGRFGHLSCRSGGRIHTFADRCNGFYTCFILWLTGAMDSIKRAKLVSNSIKKYQKYRTPKTSYKKYKIKDSRKS